MHFLTGITSLDEVLNDLHVHAGVLRTVLTVFALLTLVGGGITFVYKLANGITARLKARQGEGRRRLQRRSAFAGFVESRVRDLDNKEEWSDQRFAELEAEVETIGSSRHKHWPFKVSRGLHRERSLSQALIKSKEQLVLLQGDPGSGKSVALRFVARRMAVKARDSKRLDAVIPLYVNLKGLQAEGQEVDAQLIERFVLDTLRDGATADVDRFLEAEFENGKIDGTWFFLFDSFDEIPELLSSTDVDSAVQAYSDAISNFVHSVSKCRGVIASRHFRAPPNYGLPTFTIVPLSEKRRHKLIDKADLDPPELDLLDKFQTGDPELVALSENPLFLGLLVEYVREHRRLPRGWYDVFEAFVSRRIKSHREKLLHQYGVEGDELRLRSEELAFTMTATDGLGLSPRRSRLKRAYVSAGFVHVEQLDSAMDALQWTKLARTEEGNTSSTDPTFTFAHRRFQEYFATRVVLREPERISAERLLTDANWRETAVTLCQAQPESSEHLVQHAQQVVDDAVSAVREQDRKSDFEWPHGALHLLGLLQSAFAGNSDSLPTALRKSISELLDAATNRGTITDQKWALEVAGTVPTSDMASLLLAAFQGSSNWLREVAYRQAARLPSIPDDIAVEIRKALVGLAARGKLWREWRATRAQVMRLRPTVHFLSSARILRLAPMVDAILCASAAVAAIALTKSSPSNALALLILAALLHATYYPTASVFSWRMGRGVFQRGYGNRLLLLSLLTMFAGEIRFVTGPISIFAAVVSHDPGLIALSIVFAYALMWSIAATAISVRGPSRSWVGWLFAPLRFFPALGKIIRSLSVKSYASMVAWLLVAGGFLYALFSIPEEIGVIVFGVIAGLGTVGALVFVIRGVYLEARSWLLRRRWSKYHPTQISSAEFLEILSKLGSGGMVPVLREVRIERLLREDPEAEEMVRDLLRWTRDDRREQIDDAPPPAQEWQSSVVATWAENNGSALRSMAHPEVEDLLGQLLEDLGREEEIPVA